MPPTPPPARTTPARYLIWTALLPVIETAQHAHALGVGRPYPENIALLAVYRLPPEFPENFENFAQYDIKMGFFHFFFVHLDFDGGTRYNKAIFDVVFVLVIGLHAGDKPLPDGRGDALHGRGLFIPVIEAAQHTHALGVGRPYPENIALLAVLFDLDGFAWTDGAYRRARSRKDVLRSPVNIYEMSTVCRWQPRNWYASALFPAENRAMASRFDTAENHLQDMLPHIHKNVKRQRNSRQITA